MNRVVASHRLVEGAEPTVSPCPVQGVLVRLPVRISDPRNPKVRRVVDVRRLSGGSRRRCDRKSTGHPSIAARMTPNAT